MGLKTDRQHLPNGFRGALVLLLLSISTQTCFAKSDRTISVKWEPMSVVNGSPILFRVSSARRLRSVTGRWFDRDVDFSFDPSSKSFFALAGVSIETRPGKYPFKIKCEAEDGPSFTAESTVAVHAARYPTIKATVPKQFTEPNTDQLREIAEDKDLKKQVFAQVSSDREWKGSFTSPVSARISDVFGTTRMFNGKEESVHQGLDYAVPQGTPVLALNRGKVLLARPLFFEGTCVMIDHGQGLLSLYMHLSKLEVKEGETVNKGQTVGLSGGTGRATGPHLHIAVRWQGIYVNPATLLTLRLP